VQCRQIYHRIGVSFGMDYFDLAEPLLGESLFCRQMTGSANIRRLKRYRYSMVIIEGL
jgi:hypothetical protein